MAFSTSHLYMDGPIWIFDLLGSWVGGWWEGIALDLSTKFGIFMPYCL